VREARDWDEEYLLNLPVGEFDWFEVKGRQALDITLANVREDAVRGILSKAISAFANSGGGALVLGMVSSGGRWRVNDGGVDLHMRKPNTREWLEDVVPNLVEFPLSSFNVYVVERRADTSQIEDGRGIFIIDVPDSEQAPHQALDKKYYARVGGKSRPIGHRLVTDIFGRRRYPIIGLQFRIQEDVHVERATSELLGRSGSEPKPRRRVTLFVGAKNVGRVYARYMNCFIYIPPALVRKSGYVILNPQLREIDGIQYAVKYEDNTRRDVISSRLFESDEYGPSWFNPILPGRYFQQATYELAEDFDPSKLADEKIIWDVYADNAPKRRGSILVREIECQPLLEPDKQ